MGVVSQDDKIVQRGANPRTGLVTPFITTERSTASSEVDYINTKAQDPIMRHRASERWKQGNTGWSLTNTPLPSPVIQSMKQSRNCSASMKILPDKFVVNMPGVDDPFPQQMTHEQIRDYQEGLRSIYEPGDENSETLEQGLDSNQPALPKTLRKAVGSVIPRVDRFPGRRLRINEEQGLCRAPLLDESTNDRLLGTSEPTKPPIQPTRLSQYLPKISFLHPSHFASLPSSSRRPTDPLPSRLHPSPLRPRARTAVARPKVHRQEETIKVPSVRRTDDFGTEANQLHATNTVLQKVALSENAGGMMLENARAKLRTSQTCKCSRCASSKAHPAKKGNGGRVPCLEDEKGQRGAVVPISGQIHKTPNHTTANESKANPDGWARSCTGFGVSNDDSAEDPAHSSGIARSGSFVRRAEAIATLLDTAPLPDLAWIQHCSTQVLRHVILALWHAPPALKVLRRADARVEEYGMAIKQVLVAGVYLVILLKTILTLVKVLALIWKILALISWPARVVGVIFGCCVLG